MNKYYKNFILCGDLDQYCLLCKETFHLIPDIEKHIRWECHRKNMKGLTYIPNLKNDFIYKIGNIYYCEKCNKVEHNYSSAKKHIKTDKHLTLKENPTAEIKKPAGLYDSGYVIINKVILNKAQWNSILDNKCLICDVDVANIDEHVASEKHIVNLIQSDNMYSDNQYYRKINNETYHCFACKKIFCEKNFASHWVSCENKDEIEIKKLKEGKKGKYIAAISDDIDKIDSVEKDLVKQLQDFYNIDEEKNVAVCKFCNEHVTISFKDMIEHIKYDHSRRKDPSSSPESSEDEVVYREVPNHGLKRAELAKYGKQKCIKLNHNGSKGYCTICDKYLPANKFAFRIHVYGIIHKGHLERLGLKKPKVRDPPTYKTVNILKAIIGVHYSPEKHAVWVNREFCLDVDSFFLIYKIQNDPHYKKTKCYVCNEIFNQGSEREHCLSQKHMNGFNDCYFVEKQHEFIRELLPNLYHCGFCNTTISFSNILERHTQSTEHIRLKVANAMSSNAVDFFHKFTPSIVQLESIDGDLYKKLLNNVFHYNEPGVTEF